MLAKDEIRNWTIYKLVSPSGRIYVGKTVNFKSRLSNYRTLNCKSQPLLFKSLMKYGYINHTIEIIEQFKGGNTIANSKEMFWIRTNMSNKNKYPKQRGMNLTDGGEGQLGVKIGVKTRKKQSEAKIGKPTWNKGKKGLQIAWNKGKKGGTSWNKGKNNSHLSDEEKKEKFGKQNVGGTWNRGRKHTKEYREAIIKRQTGKPLVKKWKPVIQYSLAGEFIKTHPSVQTVIEELKLSSCTVHNILSGRTKKPQLFKFKYA